MQPCTTRDEFKSRLSDLGDIFKTFTIDDSLLPNPAAIKPDHTFKRIEEVANHQLPATEAGRVKVAIARLRSITTIRNGLQHGGAIQEAQAAAVAIGLPWPLTDWPAAWDYVRGVTLEALRELRQAIDIP